MILRSLPTGSREARKCHACHEFYGSRTFRNMCSVCQDPDSKEVTGAQLEQWVKTKSIDDQIARQIASWSGRRDKAFTISLINHFLPPENRWKPTHASSPHIKWITAKMAREILVNVRGSIEWNQTIEAVEIVVLSRVLDWWNIRAEFGERSTHNCYFGNPASGQPTTIPPMQWPRNLNIL